MKNVFLLSCMLLLAALLPAQSNEFPAVIVSSKGKIRYTSADKTLKMAVSPGVVLKKEGTIQVPGGGSAIVYCNGRIERLKTKGVYALSEVFKSGALSTLNFDPEFGKYIRASVETTVSSQRGDGMGSAVTNPKQSGDGWGSAVTNPKQSGDGWGSVVTNPKQSGDGWGSAVTNPKQSGDGWGAAVTNPKQSGDGMGSAVTNPKQSGDGWGGQGSSMQQILPFGKLVPETITFFWSKPAGATSYQLSIMDASGKVVHTATALDSFAAIDLRALNLAQDQVYSWQVKAAGQKEIVASPLSFMSSTPEAQAAAAKKAAGSSTYKEGGPVVQAMMSAVALERAEWYHAAAQEYERAYKSNPKDNMLRMMYSAFWMRYGLEPKARAVAP